MENLQSGEIILKIHRMVSIEISHAYVEASQMLVGKILKGKKSGNHFREEHCMLVYVITIIFLLCFVLSFFSLSDALQASM